MNAYFLPGYIKKRGQRRLKKVNYMEVEEQEDNAYTCKWCGGGSVCVTVFCVQDVSVCVVCPGCDEGDACSGHSARCTDCCWWYQVTRQETWSWAALH